MLGKNLGGIVMPATNSWTGNRLSRMVARFDNFPPGLRRRLISWLVGRAIPFAGTARIEVRQLTTGYGEFRLRNRRRIGNHIGGIHAAATALLAETASGLVIAMNVPDSKVPLLKRMSIDYIHRASGALEAVASLTSADCQLLHNMEHGEVTVRVEVTDETGVQPVICAMTWAWRSLDPASDQTKNAS